MKLRCPICGEILEGFIILAYYYCECGFEYDAKYGRSEK